MNSKAQIIAIVNQKGGVAKTTTTLNLAYTLLENGKKVLVVDLDPQSNLSMSLGITMPSDLKITICDLMTSILEEKQLSVNNFYISRPNGPDLIPSNILLSIVEMNLVNALSRENILKSVLEGYREHYDFIIIDCMPSLGMLTINALAACDSVIIPATPQYLSAKGLELILQTVSKVRKRINPSLKIDGVILTMVNDRTKHAKEIVQLIKEAYGEHIRIFETMIPISIKVGEANYNSKSILEFDPKNKVALAYQQFGKEYLNYGEEQVKKL